MRALLDANVLVSTALKPEAKPGQIFQRASTSFELICSEYILEELADVLARAHLQKKYKDLVAPERREQFAALVRSLATLSEVKTNLDVVSDAADNQVLAAAIDGRADFLVTGDPHLLSINPYAGCRIVTPDLFLGVLNQEKDGD
jgi:putative PIN family toxin of toxin-antitoxin system